MSKTGREATIGILSSGDFLVKGPSPALNTSPLSAGFQNAFSEERMDETPDELNDREPTQAVDAHVPVLGHFGAPPDCEVRREYSTPDCMPVSRILSGTAFWGCRKAAHFARWSAGGKRLLLCAARQDLPHVARIDEGRSKLGIGDVPGKPLNHLRGPTKSLPRSNWPSAGLLH